jgi:predicted ester cyclase
MRHISKLFFAIVVLMLFISPVTAQVAKEETNKALLLAFWEAEAARDYDQFDLFFTQDLVRHSAATSAVMPDTQVTNLDEYVQFLQGTAAMFPDYVLTPQMLVAEGDYVAFYGIWTGTYVENGNFIAVPMVGFARFQDGKIAELWVEWDNAVWNTQMMAETPLQPVETPISSVEEVVGVWNVLFQGETFRMELTQDGQVHVGTKVFPDYISQGKFAIEGNQIHWLAGEDNPEAFYNVFVTKLGDTRQSLRFELVGSDNYEGRREVLAGQTLFPADFNLYAPPHANDKADIGVNKAVVRDWAEALVERDYDRLDTIVADKFTRYSAATSGVSVTSREDMKAFLQATDAQFPDNQGMSQMIIAEGDLVAGYNLWTATDAATGKSIEVPMIYFFCVENGKLTELWIEWDNVTMMSQLGLFPPPES